MLWPTAEQKMNYSSRKWRRKQILPEAERGECRVFSETFPEQYRIKMAHKIPSSKKPWPLVSLHYTPPGHGSEQLIYCFLWHNFHMCLWFEEDCPAAARHLGDSPDKKHASGIKATLDKILSIHCSSGDCQVTSLLSAFVFFVHFWPFKKHLKKQTGWDSCHPISDIQTKLLPAIPLPLASTEK